MDDPDQEVGIGEKLFRPVSGDTAAGGRTVDETIIRVEPPFPVVGIVRDDPVIPGTDGFPFLRFVTPGQCPLKVPDSLLEISYLFLEPGQGFRCTAHERLQGILKGAAPYAPPARGQKSRPSHPLCIRCRSIATRAPTNHYSTGLFFLSFRRTDQPVVFLTHTGKEVLQVVRRDPDHPQRIGCHAEAAFHSLGSATAAPARINLPLASSVPRPWQSPAPRGRRFSGVIRPEGRPARHRR